MNVQSLLNSPVSGSRQSRNEGYPRPLPAAQNDIVSGVSPNRQKLAKDAPVFTEGTKIVGHVNYPPHEAGDDCDVKARHREFGIFPLGHIYTKGVRHIPYASDKKDFFEKTGREAFEVFQYTYKRPGEDKEYVVVWDYNIGLVRMTPFFKSCKYSKTVPAKALNQSAGMKDISYSITGGALVCQGYWVPWQAAREIAATFCWDIRWALTPVFGKDFAQMCRPPHDRTFAKFSINPDTVRFCKIETDRFREERASYQLLQPKPSSPIATSLMAVFTPPAWKQDIFTTPSESGYGTDVEHDKTGISDEISPHCRYSANRYASRSEARPPKLSSTTYPSTCYSPIHASAPTALSAPTPNLDTPFSEGFHTERTHFKVMHNDCDGAVVSVGPPLDKRQDCIEDTCRQKVHSLRTLEAAEILLSMSVVARNAAALP